MFCWSGLETAEQRKLKAKFTGGEDDEEEVEEGERQTWALLHGCLQRQRGRKGGDEGGEGAGEGARLHHALRRPPGVAPARTRAVEEGGAQRATTTTRPHLRPS